MSDTRPPVSVKKGTGPPPPLDPTKMNNKNNNMSNKQMDISATPIQELMQPPPMPPQKQVVANPRVAPTAHQMPPPMVMQANPQQQAPNVTTPTSLGQVLDVLGEDKRDSMLVFICVFVALLPVVQEKVTKVVNAESGMMWGAATAAVATILFYSAGRFNLI